LNVLGYSIVLGLGGRHTIEKVGERWCSGREASVGPHVEGAFFLHFFFGLVVTTFQHLFGIRMHHSETQAFHQFIPSLPNV
jgi:hypothetical protein